MGGWQLEVAKMALYMSFPVGLFHYFNQPEYFEDWVTSIRREIYPPENKMHRGELEKAKEYLQKKMDLEMMKAYEESEKR